MNAEKAYNKMQHGLQIKQSLDKEWKYVGVPLLL